MIGKMNRQPSITKSARHLGVSMALLLLVAGVWLAAGAAAPAQDSAHAKPAATNPAPTNITLLYTISNQGYIEPCG